MLILKDTKMLSKALIVMLWISFGFTILSLLSDLGTLHIIAKLEIGEVYAESTYELFDSVVNTLGKIHIIILASIAITFLIWFYKSYSNFKQLYPKAEYKLGWTIASWFVPIINVFKPYLIMQEMHESTNTILEYSEEHKDKRLSTAILPWWWGLLIIESILARIYWMFDRDNFNLYAFKFEAYYGIVLCVLAIITTLLFLTIIKEYSKVAILLYETIKEPVEIEEFNDNSELDSKV